MARPLQTCLKLAAFHVSEGDKLLRSQADLLAKLDAEGTDTATARQLLNQTLDMLRRHQADWVRVGHKLKDAE
jgi:hypothetical protein